MKYLKIILAIILIAAFYFIYLFIPSKVVLTNLEDFPKSAYDAQKGIVQVQYWDKWMPFKQKNDKNKTFVFDNCTMIVEFGAKVDNAITTLTIDDIETKFRISALYDSNKDKTAVKYECIIDNSTLNPIKRIQNYYTAKRLEQQIKVIMQAAKAYYEKTN